MADIKLSRSVFHLQVYKTVINGVATFFIPESFIVMAPSGFQAYSLKPLMPVQWTNLPLLFLFPEARGRASL